LDDKIQCTTKDEFAYQEMISFLPLNCHPNPENVLIIGGGDGGVAREVAKHPLVKSIVQCEIDEDVIKVARQFLPHMSCGFDDPKLKLHIGDGLEFLRQNKAKFDVIITDSSDPKGPAECLFGESYYSIMNDSLRDNGIVCCQGENLWQFGDLIKNIMSFARNLFPSVGYAYTQIPTYPLGVIGFIMCSKEKSKNFSKPVHVFTDEQVEQMQLKYYNSEIHSASFVLPTSFRKIVQ
jgi:spermidine synthase